MSDRREKPVDPVRSRADRYGITRSLGISTLTFKVSAGDTAGAMLVVENVFHGPGGPPRHLHLEQEEFFYVVAGEFLFEVGSEQFSLRAGDSLLAPRKVPHVWACAGAAGGRLLIAFTPAGLMEQFFARVSGHGAMPPLDPELWQAHGMVLLGLPLALDGL